MHLLKSETGRVLIESHRGVQDGTHVENSWEAIKAAKEQKADFIELDVQLSRDQIPFIHHNYTFPDGRRCSALNWKEIKNPNRTNDSFPLLSDVLDWAKEMDAFLSLDLKTGFLPEHLLVRNVVDALERMECWDRVMLIAWDHKELLEVKKTFPSAATRILLTGRPVDLPGLVIAAKANAVSMSYGIVRPEDVEELHSIGVAVLLAEIWQFDLTAIHELGVDLISWGKPAEVRKALSIP